MKFKKIFLSGGLFLICNYAFAQNQTDSTFVASDSIQNKVVNVPVPPVQPVVCDTIWAYTYPQLSIPTYRIGDGGELESFTSSGMYYTSRKEKDDNWMRGSNGESWLIDSKYEQLWAVAMNDLKKRMRIRDKETLVRYALKTIVYQHLMKKEKTYPPHFSNFKQSMEYHNKVSKEKAFIEKFNKELSDRGWAISRRTGKIYDYNLYMQRQKKAGR